MTQRKTSLLLFFLSSWCIIIGFFACFQYYSKRALNSENENYRLIILNKTAELELLNTKYQNICSSLVECNNTLALAEDESNFYKMRFEKLDSDYSVLQTNMIAYNKSLIDFSNDLANCKSNLITCTNNLASGSNDVSICLNGNAILKKEIANCNRIYDTTKQVCVSKYAFPERIPNAAQNFSYSLNVSYGTNSGGVSMIQTFDGGYTLYGSDQIMKITKIGEKEWTKNIINIFHLGMMTQCFDGGYALTTIDQSNVLRVTKLKSTGEFEWERIYSATGERNEIIQTFDGGFIIATFTINNYIPCAIKIKFTGELEWELEWGNSNRVKAISIIQTYDGEYAVGGYYWTNYPQMWFSKLSSKGGLIWENYYIQDSSISSGTASIVQSIDGGFVMLGTISMDLFNLRPAVKKLDSNGAQEWIQMYGNFSAGPKNIIKTLDGGFIFSQYERVTNLGSSRVCKINNNGLKVWEEIYEENNLQYCISAVVRSFTGGYVVTGLKNPFTGDYVFKWFVHTTNHTT